MQATIPSPKPKSKDRLLVTEGVKNYLRPEDGTFLSYSEWYIVWSYQEKADYQEHSLPSGFPYLEAVRQYWSSYCCISHLTRGKYAFNAGEQLMLAVIGTSFSAEYILKGAYENSIGRFSEWSSKHQRTEEDQFAYKVAREYADFVHIRPFYEFHFARQVHGLWSETPLFGQHFLRKWERKLFLTADYTVEAFYCWVIEKLTHLTYGFEPTETYAWINNSNPAMLNHLPHVRLVKQLGPKEFIVDIPRYQEFTMIASNLSRTGAEFVEIAGNSQILISLVAPRSWSVEHIQANELFSAPILTHRETNRVVMSCEVDSLSLVIAQLQSGGVALEHIYDY